MSKKILAVFGATGNQGGSVVNYVLNDPKFNSEFSVRAFTRDTSKAEAQALAAKGAEVLSVDVEDLKSIQQGLKGVHTVFLNTLSDYHAATAADSNEPVQGKRVADAAVAAGVVQIIFSTMADATSYGYPVQIYDSKHQIEKHIRGLPIKSAFYLPGSFYPNYHGMQKPRPADEPGTFRIGNVVDPNKLIPHIDIEGDTGKFIAPALAEPDKYNGKIFYGASKMYTYNQIVEILSKHTGKKVSYVQLPEQVFAGMLGGVSGIVLPMFNFWGKHNYSGREEAEGVEWTHEQLKDKPTTFEEYLAKNPIILE